MNKTVIQVAPSILAADFSNLAREIKRVEGAGADMLHIDVMDGNFVDNITCGVPIVTSIRKATRLVLDTHLMVKDPEKFVKGFAESGSDIITFHIESMVSTDAARELIKKIKSFKIKGGISLNPPTPLDKIKGLLDEADMVLVMTVNPGFGGQEFIESALDKIRSLRKIYPGDIQVDGGINYATAKKAVAAGANILACGTYIFNSNNPTQTIRQLKAL